MKTMNSQKKFSIKFTSMFYILQAFILSKSFKSRYYDKLKKQKS